MRKLTVALFAADQPLDKIDLPPFQVTNLYKEGMVSYYSGYLTIDDRCLPITIRIDCHKEVVEVLGLEVK